MIPVVSMQANGKQHVAAAASTNTPLPQVAGKNPKMVLVTCQQKTDAAAGIVGANVRTGASGVSVTATDGLYLPPGGSVVLYCAGDTHIAAIRVSAVTSLNVQIVPVV